MTNLRQMVLWPGERLTLQDAIQQSIDSLRAYGENYRHWAIAYSGGKDSSATASFVAWAIRTGRVPAPESLTVLYADTRMELPPLQQTAMDFLAAIESDGIKTHVVLPAMDDRFYVYMLGRGVPPPKNRFRWCTPQLKVEPMMDALQDTHAALGEKFLMITGVRMGESVARDQRIALSCSKDSGECGQGWFQVGTDESVADTLAPLLHWRVCHIWDWLYFEPHGYPVLANIAAVYGDGDVRTGCVGCNLASRDVALENLIKKPEWSHLEPLTELKPLYAELTKGKHRKRKTKAERRKDGLYSKNAQRLGPLTMAARAYGLERVMDIQARAGVDMINVEEEARIRELWSLNTWPQGWDGTEAIGTDPIDEIKVTVENELIVTPRLINW